MASAAVRVLRAAGIAVCLIAILSFLMFAVNQTSTASGRQQEQIAETTSVTHTHENGFRKTVDEVTEAVSSPVSGLSSSEWAERALRLIFVLLVFGFAIGYLARVVRVRV